MLISTYFHILCNPSQNYFVIRISHTSPPTKKNPPPTHFHSQQFSCLQLLYIWISQTQLTFLDTVEMGLITDMHTYKSLNVVQHLFLKTSYCILYTHLFFYVYILLIPFTVYLFLFSHSPSPPLAYPSPSQPSYYQRDMHNQMMLHMSLHELDRMCWESAQLCKTNVTLT